MSLESASASLNLFLTTHQPAAILDDAPARRRTRRRFSLNPFSQTTFQPTAEPVFLPLTTILLTQSSSGRTNTAYKTVLFRASTIESLYDCETLFQSSDDPILPALPDNDRSRPETILSYLPYQTIIVLVL